MSSDAYTDWLSNRSNTPAERTPKVTARGPSQFPGRMGDKTLKAYIVKCVTVDWMDVDEIPVPQGRSRRNIRRMAKRLGFLSEDAE